MTKTLIKYLKLGQIIKLVVGNKEGYPIGIRTYFGKVSTISDDSVSINYRYRDFETHCGFWNTFWNSLCNRTFFEDNIISIDILETKK